MIDILVTFIAFLISALPLHFAVKFLGGKTDLLKTMLVIFVSGLVVSVINSFFRIWGGILAFIVMIWIYREMFRLKWWKAFMAWILQFVFVALFYLILALIAITLLGVALL